MRLRQIALVARDLEAATRQLTRCLDIAVAYRDPLVAQFGLDNIVAPVGGDFIEIVAPMAGMADAPATAAGRYIDRQGGDSGYMVIFHVPDAAAVRQRMAAAGVRIVWQADQPDHASGQFHPADMGGVLVSVESRPGLSDIDDPMADWPPAGADWRRHVRTGRVQGLAGVAVATADPRATAARWAGFVGAPATPGRNGHPSLRLGAATIRFLPATGARGAGLAEVDLRSADPAAILAAARTLGLAHKARQFTLCGTVFNLV